MDRRPRGGRFPYTQWPERFPPLQRGVLAAAERNGVLLVSLENLYGYGPTGGRPMTESLPLAAATVKGRTRPAMTSELLAAAAAGRVRIAVGRASDFFGPGVTQGSTLGERVFGNACPGKRADFIGNPDLPHTYSYVPGIAADLARMLAGAHPSHRGAVNARSPRTEVVLGLVPVISDQQTTPSSGGAAGVPGRLPAPAPYPHAIPVALASCSPVTAPASGPPAAPAR